MEENKETVEQTVDKPVEQVVETNTEQPRNEKGQFKSKLSNSSEDTITKVDLSKPKQVVEENIKPTEEPIKEEVVEVVNKEEEEQTTENPVSEQEDTPIIEEVTEETTSETESPVEEVVPKTEVALPDNVQKLMDFMNETGGDLNDYVNLNRDVTKMDDSEVLDEYYRETKSHLTPEERSFLLEETYGVNEDIDDDKAIRMKKIALKEQVAEARAHLDRQKSKYYEEIKAGSKLTNEQQEAINFYHKYNKDSEEQKKLSEATKSAFLNKTNNVFNNKFKGFEYNVGDKRYRFNVKDADKVKTTQSDINNFINKFVGEDKSTIEDVEGYHKSLYTAMHADNIAKHFYEQGKADAIKDRIAKDKNINLNPRQTHGEVNVGGIKVRALGESSSDMKNRSFKIKKKN